MEQPCETPSGGKSRCKNTSKWGMEQLESPWHAKRGRCENTSKWGMEQLLGSDSRVRGSVKTPRNEVWNSFKFAPFKSAPAVKTPRNEVWNSAEKRKMVLAWRCENTSKWGMEQQLSSLMTNGISAAKIHKNDITEITKNNSFRVIKWKHGGWKNSAIEIFWGGRRSLNCFMLRKEKTANRTQVL